MSLQEVAQDGLGLRGTAGTPRLCRFRGLPHRRSKELQLVGDVVVRFVMKLLYLKAQFPIGRPYLERFLLEHQRLVLVAAHRLPRRRKRRARALSLIHI